MTETVVIFFVGVAFGGLVIGSVAYDKGFSAGFNWGNRSVWPKKWEV